MLVLVLSGATGLTALLVLSGATDLPVVASATRASTQVLTTTLGLTLALVGETGFSGRTEMVVGMAASDQEAELEEVEAGETGLGASDHE